VDGARGARRPSTASCDGGVADHELALGPQTFVADRVLRELDERLHPFDGEWAVTRHLGDERHRAFDELLGGDRHRHEAHRLSLVPAEEPRGEQELLRLLEADGPAQPLAAAGTG
jgi:hypothetical protein